MRLQTLGPLQAAGLCQRPCKERSRGCGWAVFVCPLFCPGNFCPSLSLDPSLIPSGPSRPLAPEPNCLGQKVTSRTHSNPEVLAKGAIRRAQSSANERGKGKGMKCTGLLGATGPSRHEVAKELQAVPRALVWLWTNGWVPPRTQSLLFSFCDPVD